MSDPQVTPPAAEPPAQPAAGAAPQAPDPKEVDALKSHLEKLKADNAKYREQLRAAKAPPADAAAKAQAEDARKQAVRIAALVALVGKPGAIPEHAEFIAWKASQDPTVTVGDDGSVIGLDEIVTRVMTALPQPAVPAITPPPPAPQIARPNAGAEPLDPKFANVRTMGDLIGLGAIALSEFKIKNPLRFAQLEAATKKR